MGQTNNFNVAPAYHADEVPFVFGAPEASSQAVSNAMLSAWAAFAHTSDPNVAGAPAWPKFDASEQHMVFATPLSTGTAPRKEQCDILAALPPLHFD